MWWCQAKYDWMWWNLLYRTAKFLVAIYGDVKGLYIERPKMNKLDEAIKLLSDAQSMDATDYYQALALLREVQAERDTTSRGDRNEPVICLNEYYNRHGAIATIRYAQTCLKRLQARVKELEPGSSFKEDKE